MCNECQRLQEQVRILQTNNDALKRAIDEKTALVNVMTKEREIMRRVKPCTNTQTR